MSFGEETQNIGNINTVRGTDIQSKMIISFPFTVSVDMSHTAAAEKGIDGGLRTADSAEHYCSHSTTAQMGASYTHGVAC